MKLDDYIKKTYAADPVLAARFANQAYRLIHVCRRYWRGYRTMQDAEVRVGGVPVAEAAATKSRWKLVPEKMKNEFFALERSVEQVLAMYCVSGTGSEDDPAPVVTGGGNYTCPTDNWTRVRQLLRATQAKWSETADRWCTEDGYEELHSELKAQIGEKDYALAHRLVPGRDELRGKFALIVREVPVRIVEDSHLGSEAEDDRLAVFAELVAGSVRRPRLEAAEALESLGGQLVERLPGGLFKPQIRLREGRDGSKSPIGRAVTGKALLYARRKLDAVDRCGKAIDPAFRKAVEAVRSELPDAEDAARARAVALNGSDEEAVELGKILLAAAALAADESSMCDAVAEAIGPTRKGG